MKLEFQFFKTTRRYPFPGFCREIQRLLVSCAKKIQHSPVKVPHPFSIEDVCLEVSCVGPDRMRSLNRVWMKKNRSTDILSFRSSSDEDVSGCLVFCLETIVQKWAKEISALGLKAVYQRLLIHGFVHLLGFDHMKPADERKMNQVERWLGVPDFWFSA